MTAFNAGAHRKTRIFGTRGEIYGDGEKIEVFDFLSDREALIDTEAGDATILGGHGGGDYGLMDSFVAAVAADDPGLILTGADESPGNPCDGLCGRKGPQRTHCGGYSIKITR